MASEPNDTPRNFESYLEERDDFSTNVLESAASQTLQGVQASTLSISKYPQDIGTDENPHYAMFYVNVRRSDLSTIQKSSEVKAVARVNNSAANRVDRNAINAVGGAVLGGAVGERLTRNAGKLTRFVATAVGAVAGGTVGSGAAAPNLTQGRETVLLSDVIALYVNQNPSVQYKANWADTELGVAGAITAPDLRGIPADTFVGTIRNLFQGAGKALHTGSNLAVYAALRESASKGSNLAGASAALQSANGVAPNPFKAQLFKSMGFRTFSFKYSFLPRNSTEYYAAQDIIKKFKTYMHPSFIESSAKTLLSYPAEFNIVYYHKGTPNEQLFKISNCVLTDMKIEYGGQDFTTFREIPGAPTEITMELTFLELEYLTRERILEGGY